MAKIRIKGLNEALKKLNELNEVLVEDVDFIVREGVNDMNNQAIRNISSQRLVDTGFLRNSQQFEQTGPRKYTMTNYASYAPYHEFGTGGFVKVDPDWGQIAAQFKGKGLKVVNIRPRPFFVPAFNLMGPRIVQDVEDAIESALK